jgi:hypothetical protein
MRDKKWLKQLEDGRTEEFTYEGLLKRAYFSSLSLNRMRLSIRSY